MHEPRSRTARTSATARRDPMRVGLMLAVIAFVASAGCQNGGVLRRWNAQRDPTLAKPITEDELGDNRNMVAKWFNPKATTNTRAFNAMTALAPKKADPETLKEIAAAEDLFQQGRLDEAEKALVKLEKKKNQAAIPIDSDGNESKEAKNLWSKVKENTFSKKKKIEPSWGEKILFYLAEVQYQQGKFVAANETYERLLNEYPGSPHKEKAVEREFAIATAWFAAGDEAEKAEKAKGGEAQQANAPPKDDGVRKAAWTDHFNGRMPLVDVEGYALRAMEHVRQHDATGPLADIATITLADHYMKRDDYENASAYYDQLITEYPKSKLLQRAMLGSIDAKLKAYLGPEYDGDGLDKAKVLIKQTMTTFPQRDQATNDLLYKDLDLIADQQAAISYNRGEFFRRTGYPGGAEFYFGEVRARWPNSPWAEKAKVQMASLAKAPRKTIAPSKILSLPGAPDPNAMGNSMGSQAATPGGFGGGGSPGAGP
jgi:outer membrane protein assembly factor BamD (BamD/ComL family)